ncbi:hypothetical protein M408DRAFT_327296 [Serendipita vermifera MAFF 305830]|uniref:Phosphatidate phosphatase APP1 catalytic domain-containing protein n=1 Tax=Serendipita vermifera MAFF 305830 TaxID=933852 RepID=A0A0C2X0T6_SERVB|nr:hypothetical protein M408DRAFT_327296 [Serendipita vermifera MAFF 305830]
MALIADTIEKITHILSPGGKKTSKDEVWLLDNIAFPSDTSPSGWKAEYVVAFFKENEDFRTRIVKTIADIIQTLNIAPNDDETEARIKERIAPFLRQIGPNMEVDVHYEGDAGARLHLGPSETNGIFSQEIDFPAGSASLRPGDSQTMRVVRQQTESPAQNSATADLETGHTFFAADAPNSWGVISDVDDTIKVTEVRDRIKLLKHTFIDLPTAVEGMPELYKALRAAISTPTLPAPFVYLSASPYNLYPFLRDFVRANFPAGELILRDMSWMDMESFVLSLTMGTQEYKEDRMQKVSRWLPRTHWVCIGDSTQTDPEAYAAFYKAQLSNPLGGRVERIWIHKVVGVNPSQEKSLNAPERFEKAFAEVPKEIVKVFENASELYAELDALKRDVAASASRKA